VLLAILVVGLAAAGVAVSLMGAARIYLSFMEQAQHEKVARIRLQGLLEWACLLVATSPYHNANNLRLAQTDPTPDGTPGPTPLLEIDDCTVTVNRLTASLYQLRASCANTPPLLVRVATTSFPARFCLLTPAAVNISHSNYRGPVLCGHARFVSRIPLSFHWPVLSLSRPAFSSPVTATSTFSAGLLQSTPLKISILDPVTPLTKKLRRGPAIETREGLLVVRDHCTVRFKKQIVEVATESGEKAAVALNAPLLILILGNCRVSGPLEGRVSILAEGKVRICGDILYLRNGQPINPKDTKERGTTALAIIARGDILYAPQKEDLTVCAALASINGSIHPAFTHKAGRLLVFGTRICAKRPWRKRKNQGFREATYIADPAILNSPPPVLPTVTLPRFFGYQIASPGEKR